MAKLSASDVMRIRDWLGVTGGEITEDVWAGMDDRTRRLYVADLLEFSKMCQGDMQKGIEVKPEREGWWWHRASDQHAWACVEVYREGGDWWWSPQRTMEDNEYLVENHVGEDWVFIGTEPGEFICQRCYLRQDAPETEPTF